MNILMMSNTFTPHVGGVARSIEAFVAEYRRRGHRVLVVAPEFENTPENERDVVRIPAIQNFNGSDFSVVLPVPGFLKSTLEDFDADIVHSHHPFLVGAMALRVAYLHRLPMVFTHHTLYERYTHYVPGDSPALRRFVITLSTSYANLCEMVFAPSESIAELLVRRGVETPIEVVPTGVDLSRFEHGNGPGFRAASGIPNDTFLVGHVGRLAPEKNLEFLAEAVAAFLKQHAGAHFLVVGRGPSESVIREVFSREGLEERLHMIGQLENHLLASAYRAMDVFAFASTSETQGMVLTEAMAAAVPVVALDASGVREVVADGFNGRLLSEESPTALATALAWFADLPVQERRRLKQNAKNTAEAFSLERSSDKALQHYEALLDKGFVQQRDAYDLWTSTRRLIEAEWSLLKGIAEAAGAAIARSPTEIEPPRR